MARVKLGIRSKIAITLTLVAILPLLATLVVIVLQWSHIRRDMAGQNLTSLAKVEAHGLRVSLTRDIQTLRMDMQDEAVTKPLLGETERYTPEQLMDFDKRWATMPVTQRPLSTVLNHRIVPYLKDILRDDRRILQAFVTDRYGQLVAATSRTDDFYQGDDPWWPDTYNDGKGQIFVPPADYDAAVSAFTLQICIPIFDQQTFVGVAKFKLDLARWLASTGSTSAGDAKRMLVRDDGRVLYRAGYEPLSPKFANLEAPIVKSRQSGWTAYKDEIQGYAPIVLESTIDGLPAKLPDMLMVMYMPESDVMAPVYRSAWLAVAAGLVIIVSLFAGGQVLVNYLILQRIRRLEQAARRLANGDLSTRVVNPPGPLGGDEIDELGKDFNEMAARVERSHNELLAASELKSNFIKIASHELRTPVSYVLGLIKLLRDNRDPERLSQAMASIAARAQRLDDIIRAMFKLMPDQLSDQTLRVEDVQVPQLLEEVYVEAIPFIEQRGQKLVIDCPREIPAIRADREKLRDVLENLLMNAIKFTPNDGQVSVKVRQELSEAVSIAVTDQGAGIPEKELPYLFQPFYSGGDVLQHSTGEVGYQKRGIGLGLAVVRHFVELHGGTVNIATGPSGSTFTVIMPIRPTKAGQAGMGMGI